MFLRASSYLNELLNDYFSFCEISATSLSTPGVTSLLDVDPDPKCIGGSVNKIIKKVPRCATCADYEVVGAIPIPTFPSCRFNQRDAVANRDATINLSRRGVLH